MERSHDNHNAMNVEQENRQRYVTIPSYLACLADLESPFVQSRRMSD